MLVLTRRIGETIVIDNQIRVTVVSVGPGRVKIGIDAPANVRVDREEIHARIVEEVTGTPVSSESNPTLETPLILGDDIPKLHNRIADKLSPEETLPSNANRLDPYRRKPR